MKANETGVNGTYLYNGKLLAPRMDMPMRDLHKLAGESTGGSDAHSETPDASKENHHQHNRQPVQRTGGPAFDDDDSSNRRQTSREATARPGRSDGSHHPASYEERNRRLLREMREKRIRAQEAEEAEKRRMEEYRTEAQGKRGAASNSQA